MSGGGKKWVGILLWLNISPKKKDIANHMALIEMGPSKWRGWTWYIGMSCVWHVRVCGRACMFLRIGTDLLKKWTNPNIKDILIAGRTLWKHTKTIVSSSFILRILPKASAAPPGLRTMPAQKAKNQPKAKTQNLGRVKLFWVSKAYHETRTGADAPATQGTWNLQWFRFRTNFPQRKGMQSVWKGGSIKSSQVIITHVALFALFKLFLLTSTLPLLDQATFIRRAEVLLSWEQLLHPVIREQVCRWVIQSSHPHALRKSQKYIYILSK